MTADLAFECLLVSRNPVAFRTINRVLHDLSICTSICLSSSRAFRILADRGADLVVIDWEGEASSDLLREIWQWGKWKKPTILAISDDGCTLPGVHITLKSPLTKESVTTSLKLAYSRMLHEYRRYTRHALMTSLIAKDDSNRDVPLTITDISQGGVGIKTKQQLMIGDELSFRIFLPGQTKAIFIHSRVLWTREYGAVGCEFLSMPPADVDTLHEWLRKKTQIKQPLICTA